ncbi:hypothetical protein, conserved [Eimeria tenella]|uniref:Uncharacterized protein n=1 Tax=Eimeria tenella TaxID=5802 RepID=U6L0U7_EIMTE|nr:hypothetical protein, conserved [Eimeria tenella]CDJ42214.1 hypothetical protein, conserved [Eimeria tenella]|eukprot:XP_013232964.1 hypothetical protein, conserved [Eimeria tenella]
MACSVCVVPRSIGIVQVDLPELRRLGKTHHAIHLLRMKKGVGQALQEFRMAEHAARIHWMTFLEAPQAQPLAPLQGQQLYRC